MSTGGATTDGAVRSAPPREVERAYRIGLAVVVLNLLGGVVTLVLGDPFAAARVARPTGDTPAFDLSASPVFRNALLTVGVLVGLGFAAFLVLTLRRLRAGASWARVVLAVLLGLGVVGVLGNLVMAAVIPAVAPSALAEAISVLSVLLQAAVVWLVFRPAARPWFAGPAPAVPPTSPWSAGTDGAPAWAPGVAAAPLDLPRRRYVGWPRRVAGGLVDHGVPTALFLVVYVPFTQGEPRVLRGGSGALIMLGVIAVCLTWQVLDNAVLQGRTGRSLGKRLAGTALVDDRTGRPLGAGRAFGRLCAHLLDSLVLSLGWLLPLVTRRRQTLGDLLSDCIVLAVHDEAVHLP